MDLVLLAAALTFLYGGRAPARAQRLEVRLDATAAHARPPADVLGAGVATYGLLGTRIELERFGPAKGDYDLVLSGGRDARERGSSWVSAALGGEWARWIGSIAARARAEAFGLWFREPFSYRAHGITIAPRASRSLGGLTFSLAGELIRGGWQTEDTLEVAGDLDVTGASVSVGRVVGSGWLEATVEGHEARNGALPGSYTGFGATYGVMAGRFGIRVDGLRWNTPAGGELGYHGTIGWQANDRLSAHLTIGKSVTDPVHGSPGSFTATLGASWRMISAEVRRAAPVVEFAEMVDGGRKVRFRIYAEDAEQVAITGDFTGWKPRPMQRAGNAWILEIVLQPGLHHFGFVLDGERWFVPDDAPGVVDDGWGRRNASLVVEGA